MTGSSRPSQHRKRLAAQILHAIGARRPDVVASGARGNTRQGKVGALGRHRAYGRLGFSIEGVQELNGRRTLAGVYRGLQSPRLASVDPPFSGSWEPGLH